jgi:hypothetical protein
MRICCKTTSKFRMNNRTLLRGTGILILRRGRVDASWYPGFAWGGPDVWKWIPRISPFLAAITNYLDPCVPNTKPNKSVRAHESMRNSYRSIYGHNHECITVFSLIRSIRAQRQRSLSLVEVLAVSEASHVTASPDWRVTDRLWS